MHLWSLGGGVNFQENGILWKVRRLTSGRLEFRYRKVQRVVLFSHLFLFGGIKGSCLQSVFAKQLSPGQYFFRRRLGETSRFGLGYKVVIEVVFRFVPFTYFIYFQTKKDMKDFECLFGEMSPFEYEKRVLKKCLVAKFSKHFLLLNRILSPSPNADFSFSSRYRLCKLVMN